MVEDVLLPDAVGRRSRYASYGNECTDIFMRGENILDAVWVDKAYVKATLSDFYW